ncbi:hypothetical protein [Pseudoduganella chitinolytica]|uniref:Uncharacterized protein n=1 Tax=Pseudoduganella chitinolytica TaxID=34070 RepID=A0ABY8BG81_9BURK|nr:hypothetical protein [Pseudoduganella chitinolytica]WEF34910.1 hypothetical protein PX653_09160 [Pseudoduganella chitinolytica]
MSDVRALPVQAQPTATLPKRIMRPCDYGMWNAVKAMETQVGTVEAYNRLCEWAASLRQKIDAGEAKAPHPMWLTDPKHIYPAG